MARKGSPRSDNLRRLVALEAARLMGEHGIDDFLTAKRKAAERLGVQDKGNLPRNAEIEAALAEKQRLFDGEAHLSRLLELRRRAREVMEFFSDFQPRLVGGVLSGTAPPGSEVELHLFAEATELVAMKLIDADIPHRLVERRLRMPGDGHVAVPAFRFVAGDDEIVAYVFPPEGLRRAPCSPVDGRPMQRAGLRELEALLLPGPDLLPDGW